MSGADLSFWARAEKGLSTGLGQNVAAVLDEQDGLPWQIDIKVVGVLLLI